MYYIIKKQGNYSISFSDIILQYDLILSNQRYSKLINKYRNCIFFTEAEDNTLTDKWVRIKKINKDNTRSNEITIKIETYAVTDDMVVINEHYNTTTHDIYLIYNRDSNLQIPLIGSLYRDTSNNFGIPLRLALIDYKPCVEYYQMGIADFTIQHKTYTELLNASKFIYPSTKIGTTVHIGLDTFMESYILHINKNL